LNPSLIFQDLHKFKRINVSTSGASWVHFIKLLRIFLHELILCQYISTLNFIQTFIPCATNRHLFIDISILYNRVTHLNFLGNFFLNFYSFWFLSLFIFRLFYSMLFGSTFLTCLFKIKQICHILAIHFFNPINQPFFYIFDHVFFILNLFFFLQFRIVNSTFTPSHFFTTVIHLLKSNFYFFLNHYTNYSLYFFFLYFFFYSFMFFFCKVIPCVVLSILL
jgi:hypothetical protein